MLTACSTAAAQLAAIAITRATANTADRSPLRGHPDLGLDSDRLSEDHQDDTPKIDERAIIPAAPQRHCHRHHHRYRHRRLRISRVTRHQRHRRLGRAAPPPTSSHGALKRPYTLHAPSRAQHRSPPGSTLQSQRHVSRFAAAAAATNDTICTSFTIITAGIAHPVAAISLPSNIPRRHSSHSLRRPSRGVSDPL